jgi:hypothetical protein
MIYLYLQSKEVIEHTLSILLEMTSGLVLLLQIQFVIFVFYHLNFICSVFTSTCNFVQIYDGKAASEVGYH